jgi:hypothetical protein
MQGVSIRPAENYGVVHPLNLWCIIGLNSSIGRVSFSLGLRRAITHDTARIEGEGLN